MRAIELQVTDVAFGGKGVGRFDGKAVFVPYTIDGEKIVARIVRERTKFAEAQLESVNQRSPHRVEPRCPYFGRCGGCAYQHIEYEHQLALKWRQVRDILQRIGKFENIPLRPIVPAPHEYGYRNRITVHAQEGGIGFFQRDSNRLIDIERCPIARDEVNAALREFRTRRPRDGHYTLRAAEGPRVFAQTNDDVAGSLRDFIDSIIPANQQLLVDAFCGAGFFAKTLMPKFKQVVGIDWDRFAIEEARKKAAPNETYIAGDVADELAKLGITTSFALIVDPPATGLTESMRQIILEMAPETFIYVSCNPATLARDLKNLTSNFQIESVTPFDMFPQTAEIEVVAHLTDL